MMQQTAATSFPTTFQCGNIWLRIQERLGSGAFGVVYKVQDLATSNFYALKSILCLNASALQNAVREAEMLKQISHPNIIAIQGTGQVNGTQGYLHMLLLTEYCPGGNFNQWLPSPSTNQMNLKWMKQTAHAIAYLHSRNVVHRDLKPDNVLLTATEDVNWGILVWHASASHLLKSKVMLKISSHHTTCNQRLEQNTTWLRKYSAFAVIAQRLTSLALECSFMQSSSVIMS